MMFYHMYEYPLNNHRQQFCEPRLTLDWRIPRQNFYLYTKYKPKNRCRPEITRINTFKLDLDSERLEKIIH